jgi:hypothetical protein
LGGVEQLRQTIAAFLRDSEACALAVRALWNLGWLPQLKSRVLSAGALPGVLLAFAYHYEEPDMQRVALGALRSLIAEETLAHVVDAGTTHVLLAFVEKIRAKHARLDAEAEANKTSGKEEPKGSAATKVRDAEREAVGSALDLLTRRAPMNPCTVRFDPWKQPLIF